MAETQDFVHNCRESSTISGGKMLVRKIYIWVRVRGWHMPIVNLALALIVWESVVRWAGCGAFMELTMCPQVILILIVIK